MTILDRFNDNGVDKAAASVVVDEEHGFGSAIVNIDIDRIEPNPGQFRKHFDDLEDLAKSIKEKGLRIPIKVSRRGNKYRIVYGERRWQAARLAGLKLMPCIVTSSTDENTDETSLIENLTREGLDIVDEAMAIREFDKRGYKGDGIAKMIGKSTTYIHRCLKVGMFIEAASNGGFMNYNEFVSLPLGQRHFLVAAEMNDIDAATKLLRVASAKRLTESEMTDLAYVSDVVREAGAEPQGTTDIKGKAKEGRKNRKKVEQTVFTGKTVEKALIALITAADAINKVSAMGVDFKVKNSDRTRLSDMAGEADAKISEISGALSAIKNKLLGINHAGI